MQASLDRFFLLFELFSSSSSEEDDDDIPLRLNRRRRQRRRKIENYIEDVVNYYTEKQFRENFRVSRETVNKLVELFEESEFFPNDHRCKSAEEHILAFIWYAANKSTLRSVSERFNMAISTLFIVNDRVMNFLLSLAPHVIYFPQDQAEKEQIAEDFHDLAGFPGVVGAIDGTYIDIKTPAGRLPSTYINRHDKTSMTLQAICDANYRFLDCFTGLPSKVHDARIFKLSFIYPLTQQLGPDFHLIGDAAYGIGQNILTPYRNYGNLTNNQIRFNHKLSSTRVKIENSFRLLKSRFRHLVRTDFMSAEKIGNFILCCCVLHNLCLSNNDHFFELDEVRDINNYGNNNYRTRNERYDRALGEAKRNHICMNL